ncbi:thiamine diphosphokinase [Flavobacteriaceae bacterium SZ-1-7]|uniref:thiamine diphosphokinase n=1 Tax=Tamlana sedimenti TaxID=3134126 RepID=UPI0031249DC1
MHLKKAFILIDGEQPNKLPNLSEYDLVCATDGAYRFLAENNITPDFICGDFDALEKLPINIETITTPNQDYTDFEKALKILKERDFSNIHVYGASGKEQDHFLGNLSTAIKWKPKLNLTFFDNYGYYFLADKTTRINHCKGKTVSLVPFPEALGIVTSGLQYPLYNESLTFGGRIGTRNVAIEDEVTITFESGALFVFVND